MIVIGGIWFIWMMYGCMMALQRAQTAGTLTTAAKIFGYPWLAIFIVVDALLNYTLCTIIFLELPDRWLTTGRLEKYKYHFQNTWRGKMASWICINLLDCLAPDGRHCQG